MSNLPRQHLLACSLAHPLHAAIISLLTSTASLQRLAVICFVVTYFVIANALMVRRYLPGGTRMRCSR